MAKTTKPKADDAERTAVLADIEARDAADDTGEDAGAIDTSHVNNDSPDDVAPPAPKGLEFEADPRAEIFKSIAEDRGKGEGTEGDPAASDDDAEEAEEAPAVATSGKDAANAPRKVRFDELDPETDVVVKVNGQDVTVKAGELVGQAQKYIAGDDYLAKAKTILDSARRAQAQPADQSGRPADQSQVDRRGQEAPDAGKGKPTPAERMAKLRDIAVRLQTGTEEEATAALAELDRFAQPSEGAVTQGDVARLAGKAVTDTLIERAAMAEADQALTDFAHKHGNLAKEDDLFPSVMAGGYQKVVEGLRAIGVPDEDFQNNSARDVIRAYAQFRQDPRYRDKLAPLTQVYDEVGSRFEQKYSIAPSVEGGGNQGQNQTRAGQQQPSVRTTESRVVRKQTVVTQPRPAAIRAQGVDPTSRDAERDQSSTIARMAAAREGTALAR